MDLSLRPGAEAQRQRLPRRCKKADGEEQAEFDRRGKHAAHNRSDGEQKKQNRGRGFA